MPRPPVRHTTLVLKCLKNWDNLCVCVLWRWISVSEEEEEDNGSTPTCKERRALQHQVYIKSCLVCHCDLTSTWTWLTCTPSLLAESSSSSAYKKVVARERVFLVNFSHGLKVAILNPRGWWWLIAMAHSATLGPQKKGHGFIKPVSGSSLVFNLWLRIFILFFFKHRGSWVLGFFCFFFVLTKGWSR
jgi:hypothetical protein